MADCLLIGRVGKGSTFNKPMITKTVIFTENGTWDPPDEVVGQNIRVLCFGAGKNGNNIAGGQGGSMNISEVRIPDKSIINVTIGAAGYGTTSFGNYVSAAAGGGSGGGIINASNNNSAAARASQFGGGGLYGRYYTSKGYANSQGGTWGGGGGGVVIDYSKGGTYGGGGAGGFNAYPRNHSLSWYEFNACNTNGAGGTYGGNSSGSSISLQGWDKTSNPFTGGSQNEMIYEGISYYSSSACKNGINTSTWTNVDKIPENFSDNYNPSKNEVYLRGYGRVGSSRGGGGGFGGNGGNGISYSATNVAMFGNTKCNEDYEYINVSISAPGGGGGYGGNGGKSIMSTSSVECGGSLWCDDCDTWIKVYGTRYVVYGGGGGGYGGDGGDRCGGGGGYGKQAKGGYNFGGGGGYFAPGGNNGGGGGGYGPAGKGGDYGQNGGIGAGGGANNGKGGPGICIIQYQTNNY